MVSGGLLQLEDAQTTGIALQSGFSGAPVWDDELQSVIGIVKAIKLKYSVIKHRIKTCYHQVMYPQLKNCVSL